jgi:hypothetical protein
VDDDGVDETKKRQKQRLGHQRFLCFTGTTESLIPLFWRGMADGGRKRRRVTSGSDDELGSAGPAKPRLQNCLLFLAPQLMLSTFFSFLLFLFFIS